MSSVKEVNGPCQREEEEKEKAHGQCSKDPFLNRWKQ